MVGQTHLEVLTKFVAVSEKKPKYALFLLKAHVLELLPDNRVKVCYHHRLPERENVEVWYNAENARAYYCGLMKCGQVWLCPLCAQRVAIIRRDMLKEALANAHDKYLPLLVTYTAQHYKGQPLKTLLDGMSAAYRRMRQQRLWRTYKEEYMIRGEIRAVEITYGESGWHPHFHTIILLDIGIMEHIKNDAGQYDIGFLTQALTQHLTPMWIDALGTQKLSAMQGPGLNVRAGWDQLNDYVTKGGAVLPASKEKWGIVEETTMGQLKKTRKDGDTVWQLLAKSWSGFSYAGQLFAEYASATRGKSSLQWSPGLKAELANNRSEETEVIEDDNEPGDILLSTLSASDWRAVVETGAEGILIDNASTGDPAAVAKIVAEAHRRVGAQSDDLITY